MAELTREIIHDKRGASSVIAWLALLLAAAALILAWLAYNRSGEDLESRIQRQVNQTVNETRQEGREVQNEVQDETPRNTGEQPATDTGTRNDTNAQ